VLPRFVINERSIFAVYAPSRFIPPKVRLFVDGVAEGIPQEELSPGINRKSRLKQNVRRVVAYRGRLCKPRPGALTTFPSHESDAARRTYCPMRTPCGTAMCGQS